MTKHWVDPEPFDIEDELPLTPEQEKFYSASQWRLMWWRFKRHKVAVVSLWLLVLLYASTLITEVIAPYSSTRAIRTPFTRRHRASRSFTTAPSAGHSPMATRWSSI